MVGYVHYRKESPPPATGRPAQSGFLHQLSGWKSRQLVQIFSNKLQQKLIKMPYQMRRLVAAPAAAIPTAGAHLFQSIYCKFLHCRWCKLCLIIDL